MSLLVIDPGLYTLVVDEGRPATRSLGVPLGGAADQMSLALGNALVGNPPGAAALEITLSGPTLRAECDLACVLYGAPFELGTDRQRLEAGKTFTLAAGEELRIGAAVEGMRTYFCIRGGFDLPLVLDSRSGFEPLPPGARLPCSPAMIRARSIPVAPACGPQLRVLRVLPGTQADWFGQEDFYDQQYRISSASNRMGLRLQGEPLSLADRELSSEPVCPGSVQVTRDGQCIVLGVDGQTIGGYPKIAQVISEDLDILGQLRPDQYIRFTSVSLDKAEELYRSKCRELQEWVVRLRETVDWL